MASVISLRSLSQNSLTFLQKGVILLSLRSHVDLSFYWTQTMTSMVVLECLWALESLQARQRRKFSEHSSSRQMNSKGFWWVGQIFSESFKFISNLYEYFYKPVSGKPSMEQNKKVTKPSGFQNISQTMGSRDYDTRKQKMTVAERFIIKQCIGNGSFFKAYRAIDLVTRKFVTVYMKPFSKEKAFSKNVEEELKEKISPPVNWANTYKIDKNVFDIEVHARFGPSLQDIMRLYKKKLSQETLFLLAYHLLKLIDRIDSAGYVCRSLSPSSIVLSQSFLKNDLFMLHTFEMDKKNEESSIAGDPKYCSIGTHLRIKTSSRDTVESACYILMDLFLEGRLFHSPNIPTEKEYLEMKNLFRPEGLPKLFIDFFCYVKNLNHGEEVKFTDWKRTFKKEIGEEVFSNPYEWIKSKNMETRSEKERMLDFLINNPHDSEITESNSSSKPQIEEDQDSVSDQLGSTDELDEDGRVCDKMMETQAIDTSGFFMARYRG